MKDQYKQWEQAVIKAGGGVWFHNQTEEQVIVEVRFYPIKKLYIKTGQDEVPITKEELERDYHRLRL